MADAGEWVGCSVKVKTNLGEEFEGEVFTYDKGSNIVVLKTAGEGGTSTVRLLKANFIKEMNATSGPPEGSADLRLPHVDYGRCLKRYEEAMKQAKVDADRVGINVSAEAQELFDQFSKTMKVNWDKKSIIVLDEIRVEEPYKPENCALIHQAGSTTALARVKKVLEMERARMQMTA